MKSNTGEGPKYGKALDSDDPERLDLAMPEANRVLNLPFRQVGKFSRVLSLSCAPVTHDLTQEGTSL